MKRFNYAYSINVETDGDLCSHGCDMLRDIHNPFCLRFNCYLSKSDITKGRINRAVKCHQEYNNADFALSWNNNKAITGLFKYMEWMYHNNLCLESWKEYDFMLMFICGMFRDELEELEEQRSHIYDTKRMRQSLIFINSKRYERKVDLMNNRFIDIRKHGCLACPIKKCDHIFDESKVKCISKLLEFYRGKFTEDENESY